MRIIDIACYLGGIIGGILGYLWGRSDGYKKGREDYEAEEDK